MASESIPGRLEALLAEAAWLEGLARALVRDRDEARELVQDVWVTAAERAPQRIDRPRAWLAAVLRNALASRRRATAPRERRERERARPGTVAGTGDVVARAEAQRSLVEHVLALDEPWRSTVLLRFFDGLASAEIARRTGVPESTVRNRLAHALEQLRERLERGGTDWRQGLVALAGPAGGLVQGGVAMASAVKVGMVVALGASALWWMVATRASEPGASRASPRAAGASPSPPAPTTASLTETGSRESVPPSSIVASAPEARDGTAEAATAPPIPPGMLEVVVLEHDEPCARPGGVVVAAEWIPSLTSPDAFPPDTLQTELALGIARFERVPHGRHGVRVLLDDGIVVNATTVVPKDRGVRCEILVGTAVVAGFLYDARGEAMADVVVKVFRRKTQQERRTLSDAHGAYRFDGLAPGEYGGVVEARLEREKRYFEVHGLARDEVRRLDIGLPEPWTRWRGVLRSAAGAEHRGGARLSLRAASGNPALQREAVAEDGSFDAAVVPGSYSVTVRLHALDDFEASLGEVEIGTTDVDRDLVLPGARLTGRAYCIDGAPLSERAHLSVGVRAEGANYGAAIRHAEVGPDGSFAVDSLAPGVYLVNVHPLVVAGGVDSLRVEVLPGEVEVVVDVGVRVP